MKLESFIYNNHIKLPTKSLNLCKTALNLMKQGIDPIHNERHIESLISNLNFLLKKSENLKQKIDFQVLLLSICWHDVWISKRIPKNLIHLTFHQIVEGLGSALIFKKYALKAKLNKKLLRSVYYAIRKHSSFQVIPPFTLEAKILIDLDK